MKRNITSRNIGGRIYVEGEIFQEKDKIYIVEGYAKAKILNPEIFEGTFPKYVKLTGKLTIEVESKYPEFAVEVESYEARKKS